MRSSPQTELEERLRCGLHPDDYAYYQKVYDYHFWEWKMHRISEEGSLRGLRSFLYHAGVLKLERERRPRRGRPFHSYAAELGIPIDVIEARDPFSGVDPPSRLSRREFPNPGDCLELYEGCKPRWVMHGYGETLTYSLEHTLSNCLIEPLRGDARRYVMSYLSPSFYGALKRIEIWSVTDFALSVQSGVAAAAAESDVAPSAILIEAIAEHGFDVPLQAFMDAQDKAQTLLDKGRPQFENFGDGLLFGTMLGLLLDELILRTAIPNGMGHCYAYAHAALSALKDGFSPLRKRLTSMRFDPEDLERKLGSLIETAAQFQKGEDTRREQAADENWRRSAAAAADALRTFAFDCRTKRGIDEKEADLVFTAANAIWRWLFFLEQRESFSVLTPSLSPQYRTRVIEHVWRWLRRPWGILTTGDVNRAFRGLAPGDEKDQIPRAFTVLSPILKADIEEHLASAFNVRSTEQARDLVLRFIGIRVDLYLARHLTRRLCQPRASDESARRAKVLIDLFLTWVFEIDKAALDQIEGDIDCLPQMLRSGKWMRDFVAIIGDPATRWPPAVAAIVLDYLNSPESFIAPMFRFDESKFRLREWVGVFPPESFCFVSPAERAESQNA
jgi:hypothetical protein